MTRIELNKWFKEHKDYLCIQDVRQLCFFFFDAKNFNDCLYLSISDIKNIRIKNINRKIKKEYIRTGGMMDGLMNAVAKEAKRDAKIRSRQNQVP